MKGFDRAGIGFSFALDDGGVKKGCEITYSEPEKERTEDGFAYERWTVMGSDPCKSGGNPLACASDTAQ